MAIINGKPVNAYSLSDAAKLRKEVRAYAPASLIKPSTPAKAAQGKKRSTKKR